MKIIESTLSIEHRIKVKPVEKIETKDYYNKKGNRYNHKINGKLIDIYI